MSAFADFIVMDCKAEIACAGCGAVQSASSETEGEAVRQLDRLLERDGWRELQGKPCCPKCVRAAADESLRIEQAEGEAGR